MHQHPAAPAGRTRPSSSSSPRGSSRDISRHAQASAKRVSATSSLTPPDLLELRLPAARGLLAGPRGIAAGRVGGGGMKRQSPAVTTENPSVGPPHAVPRSKRRRDGKRDRNNVPGLPPRPCTRVRAAGSPGKPSSPALGPTSRDQEISSVVGAAGTRRVQLRRRRT